MLDRDGMKQKIHKQDTRTGKVLPNAQLTVQSPGALIMGLQAYSQYDEILGTARVQEFWSGVKPDDPKLIYLQMETGFSMAYILHEFMYTSRPVLFSGSYHTT